MPPDHAKTFGGGAAETTLTPIVLVAMLVAIVLILVLPRRWVIVPFLFVTFLVPFGQAIVLGGVHLFVFRVIVLVGWVRLLAAKSGSTEDSVFAGGLNSVDRAFLWCTLCEGIAVVLLFHSSQALINQFGFLWDFLGGYFLLRFLIRDEKDILRAIKCLAFLVLILTVCMLRERVTMQNVFGYLGGSFQPEFRDNKVRAQGVFEHALTAGAFGATLMPLFCLLWRSGKSKVLGVLGLIGSVMMTWTTNSSTPLLAFAAGIVGICFWPFRRSMRAVRWGIVIGLIALQCVMKSPVWFLMARIDLTGGSSGYHRAEVVDQFIRHFFDWWLIGIKDTSSWGWGLWDTQNEFVMVGQTGGLLAFIFFIVMISRCFARMGNARKTLHNDINQEWFLWFLGAALFSNVVCFFGVNYFDQSKVAWFALLVIISTATAPLLLQTASETENQPKSASTNLRFAHTAPSSPRTVVSGLNYKREVRPKLPSRLKR
jgi:hypothetical protein